MGVVAPKAAAMRAGSGCERCNQSHTRCDVQVGQRIAHAADEQLALGLYRGACAILCYSSRPSAGSSGRIHASARVRPRLL